jgi:glycosyltransferase involved in cell wall biosynthesis
VEPGLARVFAPSVTRRLAELIERERVDAVIPFSQLDGKFALWAAGRAGVPCIVSAQNLYRFWGSLPMRLLKEGVYRSALRRNARFLVCTSTVVQDQVVERYGIPRERTGLLANGIDVSAFSGVEPSRARQVREALGIEPGDCMLLNVGRIDLQKGQDVLLRAFGAIARDFPRAKLVFVGAPTHGNDRRMATYEEELHGLVRSQGISSQVIFTGWRNDIPELLAAADVYVHPARWEGWPLALVEGMAARRPVIASDCAGWPEGFETGVHGYIVPTENVRALSDAMRRVLSVSPAERRAMGEAARRLAEESYDISVIGDRFVEMLSKVLDGPQPRLVAAAVG